MELDVQVTGLRESLKVLNKLDKDLRKESIKKVRFAASPMVAVARSTFPSQPPLSGMANKSRVRYQPGRVKSQVILKIGGRPPRNAKQWPVLTLQQNNAGGALYSMAGMADDKNSRATNDGQRQFSELLEAKSGKPQRGMWSKIRTIRRTANLSLEAAVKDVERTANRKLAK